MQVLQVNHCQPRLFGPLWALSRNWSDRLRYEEWLSKVHIPRLRHERCTVSIRPPAAALLVKMYAAAVSPENLDYPLQYPPCNAPLDSLLTVIHPFASLLPAFPISSCVSASFLPCMFDDGRHHATFGPSFCVDRVRTHTWTCHIYHPGNMACSLTGCAFSYNDTIFFSSGNSSDHNCILSSSRSQLWCMVRDLRGDGQGDCRGSIEDSRCCAPHRPLYRHRRRHLWGSDH